MAGPAKGMVLAGFLAPLGPVLGLGIVALLYSPPDRFFREGGAVLIGLLILSLIMSGWLITAAGKMRQLASYELAMIGGVLSTIPFTTLAFPISLPVGIWTFSILRKPEVRAAFERMAQRRVREDRSGSDHDLLWFVTLGPAAGLLLTALVALVEAVVASVVVSFVKRDELYHELGSTEAYWTLLAFGFLLACLVIGTIVSGALALRRFRSYGLCLLAVFLAMAPFSYHCLIGLPVGIWALWVLRRPEVRAAFSRNRKASASRTAAPPPPPLAESQPAQPAVAPLRAGQPFWRSAFYYVFDSRAASRPNTTSAAPVPPHAPTSPGSVESPPPA